MAKDELDLAVEIGGTKLQFCVGRSGGPWEKTERSIIEPQRGAQGILEILTNRISELKTQYSLRRAGIGFGGPVDCVSGKIYKSHQIRGWDGFDLKSWFSDQFQLPAQIGNDCDVAALAEARLGAGRNFKSVFYVTVGSGIGGGLVLQHESFGSARPASMEIGHLRPGIHATDPSQTVESVSSGWGIARQVQAKITNPSSAASVNDVQDLRRRCANDAQKLTAVDVAEAALDGNTMAAEVISEAVKTLGWGIAQAIALMAPEVVVIGGGVSLMKESLFFTPLQTWIAKYVFPPLADTYAMRRAELGEEVVLHGGLLLAEQAA